MHIFKPRPFKIIIESAFDHPLIIMDQNYNILYAEDINGAWKKYEYNQYGEQLYLQKSNGYWGKNIYDENGNEIYYENSNNYWSKTIYNEKGIIIYHETSTGIILDQRN